MNHPSLLKPLGSPPSLPGPLLSITISPRPQPRSLTPTPLVPLPPARILSCLDFVYNPPQHHHPLSTIRSPYRYTYGNGLDQYDDDEESDDTVPTEYLPRLTPTSYPGTAGRRGGNAQRPFVVDEQNSTRPELGDGDDESTWFGEEEDNSILYGSEAEDTAGVWSIRFARPPRSKEPSCEEYHRSIGIGKSF